MGAAPHFECSKLRRQRTQIFKAQAHACRAGTHSLDVLPLVANNSLCLLPLVSELTLESALRLYGLCRLTPSPLSSHYVVQCTPVRLRCCENRFYLCKLVKCSDLKVYEKPFQKHATTV